MSVQDYEAFYRRSIEDREGFWAQQARMIDWKKGWDKVLDYSNPPFARWYVGGETNLCHNAVDRHLETRGDQDALVYISTETEERTKYTFREFVEWVESSEPSYILYTSGTTGTPKGVQRDTGGHAVALRASMEHIFDARPGETMLTASDIGWVVGHSYIVYGPLLYGMTTIVYEGLPIRPDPGIWWKIVQDHRVTTMFTAPTAIRALRKQDPEYMRKYDTSTLRNLFLAGEPLDEPTSRGISEALGVSVRDNYWQTETG